MFVKINRWDRGKIRRLGGVEKIINLLPRQFSEKRREDTPQSTWTLNNNNLRSTLRTLRHDIKNPYPRIGTEANLRMVLGTLRVWGGDETSKGLTLQVLYNLMREADKMHDTPQQQPLLHLGMGTYTDLHSNSTEEVSTRPRPITRVQGLLYSLETDTRTIEQVTWTLHKQSSHHHVTQSMGLRILKVLTPRGFTLTVRTPRERDLKWSHSVSVTNFDTLPDLVTVVVNLTHWHVTGNITQLIQMLLRNHSYVDLKSFLQEITTYNSTLGDRIKSPLNTHIRALGSTTQTPIIHLLLPHWETGHLDLTPRSRRHPPGGRDLGWKKTHDSRGEQCIYLESRWR